MARPALRLYRGGDTAASSRSWVGGLPSLPAHVAWPTWDPTEPVERSIAVLDRKIAAGVPKREIGGHVFDPLPSALRRRDGLLATLSRIPRPLSFLAQIDLAAADPLSTASVDLPDHGIVWVFQDTELIYSRYRRGWRVIYEPNPGPLVERLAPAPLEPFTRAAVSLRPAVDLPFNLGQPLADAENDGWPVTELEIAINAEPDTALGIGAIGGGSRGDEWCQPRVYASATLPDGERAVDHWPQLVEGSRSWSCLLALGSDKDRDPRWLWGDVGSLTYWLSGPDRRDLRFDNAWLCLDTT